MTDPKQMERRAFLKRAAATGVAAAWAAPIVQTVAAGPAFASHVTCPDPVQQGSSPCRRGTKNQGGCIQTCYDKATAKTTAGGCAINANTADTKCTTICSCFCGGAAGSASSTCCNSHFCDAANWSCTGTGATGAVSYIGSVLCCPTTCPTSA